MKYHKYKNVDNLNKFINKNNYYVNIFCLFFLSLLFIFVF